MSAVVEVRVEDLIGSALDWAVAKAVPQKHWPVTIGKKVMLDTDYEHIAYSPSTDWSQGGPLIEKYKVLLTPPTDMVHRNFGSFDKRNGWYESGHWGSTIFGKERKHRRTAFHHPDSPLIVAMRAIVQFELGSVVRIPSDLVQP